ncbi:MAG: hypothetical protein AAF215_13845 [Cyanobacteria bacterium P01_A01_bin.123]
MLPLATSLQVLLFTHMVLVLRYGISLRGNGLEILLLIATIVLSIQALFKVSFKRSPRWLKGLYIANCIGLLPLWLTATIMGFCIHGTPIVGTFDAPSGTRITLKQHIGLLGCSVRPYIIQGVVERRIYHEDNYVFCALAFTESKPIEVVRWSPNETQLILTIDQEDYTFEVAPETAPSNLRLEQPRSATQPTRQLLYPHKSV